MFDAIQRLLGSTKRRGRRAYNQSLERCFELANEDIYIRSQGFLHNRACTFFRAGDRLPRLERQLKDLAGIDGYAYVGSGDNAVIVQYSDDQLIRLRAPAIEDQANTQDVPAAPMICPIWKEVYFEAARLNFVPHVPNLSTMVSNKEVSRQTAEGYIYALMDACFQNDPEIWFYDYKNYDFKFEQIGMISGRIPIIIDLGAAILCEDAMEKDAEQLAQDRRLAAECTPSHFPNWDGKWVDDAERAHLQALSKPPAEVLGLPEVLE